MVHIGIKLTSVSASNDINMMIYDDTRMDTDLKRKLEVTNRLANVQINSKNFI